jgi:hypothetical protein
LEYRLEAWKVGRLVDIQPSNTPAGTGLPFFFLQYPRIIEKILLNFNLKRMASKSGA